MLLDLIARQGAKSQPPYANSKGNFPLEWVIIIGWSVLGVAFWIGARKIRSSISEEERRRLILGENGR